MCKKEVIGSMVGQIIRWFDLYAEGIVKDSGLGVVQKITWHSQNGYEWPIYEVWRFGHNDFVNFGPDQIELAEE